MNTFELFSMIYLVLEAHLDERGRDEEFVLLVSDMNPFLWEDMGSADPSEYEQFTRYVGACAISVDVGYDIARMYLARFAPKVVSDAFRCYNKERWRELCEDYLSHEHKGGQMRTSVDFGSRIEDALPFDFDGLAALAKEMEGKTLKALVFDRGEARGQAGGVLRVQLGRFSLDLFNEWHPVCVGGAWLETHCLTWERKGAGEPYYSWSDGAGRSYLVGEKVVAVSVFEGEFAMEGADGAVVAPKEIRIDTDGGAYTLAANLGRADTIDITAEGPLAVLL